MALLITVSQWKLIAAGRSRCWLSPRSTDGSFLGPTRSCFSALSRISPNAHIRTALPTIRRSSLCPGRWILTSRQSGSISHDSTPTTTSGTTGWCKTPAIWKIFVPVFLISNGRSRNGSNGASSWLLGRFNGAMRECQLQRYGGFTRTSPTMHLSSGYDRWEIIPVCQRRLYATRCLIVQLTRIAATDPGTGSRIAPMTSIRPATTTTMLTIVIPLLTKATTRRLTIRTTLVSLNASNRVETR